MEDEPAQANFKSQHRAQPEGADDERVVQGGGGDLRQRKPGNDQDDQGSCPDADLPGAVIADAPDHEANAQDAVDGLGHRNHHPDKQSTKQHWNREITANLRACELGLGAV